VKLLIPIWSWSSSAQTTWPQSVEEYESNINALIDRVKGDMPSAEMVLHRPHDFTPDEQSQRPAETKIVQTNEAVSTSRGVAYQSL